jgi:hypothetical protein
MLRVVTVVVDVHDSNFAHGHKPHKVSHKPSLPDDKRKLRFGGLSRAVGRKSVSG